MQQLLKDIKPFFFRRPIVYVDAGACKGETFEALLASELPLVEAHLFEPDPQSFPMLEETVRRHGKARNLTRVSVHNAALGDHDGTVALQAGGPMTGALEMNGGGASVEVTCDATFEAPCVRLDDVARRFFDRHISVLKIDVEGHELEVLAGAEELLRSQNIDVIYVDAGVSPEAKGRTYYRAIEDALTAYDYRLFKIYEQTNDHAPDAPLLRGMSLAFMSSRFAETNPMRLSKEVFEAHAKIAALTATVDRAQAELAAAQEARAQAEDAAAAVAGTLEAREAELAALRDAAAKTREEIATLQDSLADGMRRLERESARAQAAEQRAEQAQTVRAVLEAEREGRLGEIATLRDEREARLDEIAALQSAHAAARDKLAALQVEHDARLREIAALRSERDAARGELAALRAEHDARLREIAALRTSTSWRLTAPLRLLKSPLLAVKRRLRRRAAIRAIAASELFDRAWYLERYPDVAAAGVDPVRHYVRSGAAEGRNPGPAFSTRGYLARYPDVAAGGLNPLHHYIVHGMAEGRAASPPSSVRAEADEEVRKEIDDLTRKLWGGFSAHGARGLEEISADTANAPDLRARAAWELTRWRMSAGEPAKALDALAIVRECSKPLARSKKTKLLQFEALLATGEIEKAHARISEALRYNPADGDYLLALSNYWLKASELGGASRAEADHQRLAAINKMFAHAGLSPIALEPGRNSLTIEGIRREAPWRGVEGPKISVLMAAYGAEEHLHLAVESVLAQTWRNLELIIVDDCSPDGTWEVMRRYADQDPRVRIDKNPKNLGAYATRNRALRMATGEYITVHDSDDWSHPEMLERQMAPLLEEGGPRATFSMMARVTEDMAFGIRPSRRNLEIVHRSYPSLLMRKADIDDLGEWDGVRANADAEMVARVRRRFGQDALQDVLPDVPMSFFLTRPDCLTQQAHSSLLSLTFGVRHEYDRQADYMRAKTDVNHVLGERLSKKTPFAAPEMLLPAHLRTSREYDLVIVSDLSLKGGTRACNTGYIDLAAADGRRVGLFHWPRGDLRLLPDIDPAYRERNQLENVDILTWEEEVRCRRVIVHHPPIMAFALDRFPRIEAEEGMVLVNQLPFQLTSRDRLFYDVAQVDAEFERLFGFPPLWAPISALTRRHLAEFLDPSRMTDQDWSPPLLMDVAVGARRPEPAREPVIGRHSRDHWTKWPETPQDLRGAYLAGDPLRVRILGGAKTPHKVFGEMPLNWDVHEFDSIGVESFIDGLDFFVHFTHSQYIEEFGRNVAEAMARGVPAILPARFEETFGDAAVYCEPAEVASVVERLWSDPEAYAAAAQRGQRFVAEGCGKAAARRRLFEPLKYEPARYPPGAKEVSASLVGVAAQDGRTS